MGRVAQTLALPVLLLGCSRSDASDVDAHSAPPSPDTAGEEVPLTDHPFPLLVWAASTVEQEYFDKTRIDPRGQLVFAVQRLGLHTPEFFARVDDARDELHVRVLSQSSTFALSDLDSLSAAALRLQEILEFTQTVLDLDPEPLHELEYAAINGLFAPLDPHTILLTPEEHTDLGVRTKGEFGGIGAQIRAEGRRIVVVRVLPGMPAERAGLQAGDVILEIGRERTVNMTSAEAQALLRGPVGSEVRVKVRRAKKVLEVDVTRNTIRIESVVAEALPERVAYLQITTFQENTAEQVRQALERLGGGDPLQGIVFDLRGNAGGLLTQATAVVDLFVARGDLVIVRSAGGRETDPAKDDVLVGPEVPIVVLLDEDSASAAEIVGGGLQALGRAVVVGRTSFGKGTVQMVRPEAPYGRELALKLTVAEYLVAGDNRIQSVGVVPDVELTPVELSGIPGVVRYFDTERFERSRERSRTAHLPSARHDAEFVAASSAPPMRLHYLWTDELPPSVAALPQPPEQLQDPEVRLAQQLALSLREITEPDARRAALGSTVDRLARDEDRRIAEALGRDGVQWTNSPADDATPPLGVSARLAAEGPIRAGEPFTLRVEVTNRGTEPAHRVHLITDCVHDELDGIEVMVGTVAPAQTVVRELKLHVMPWHDDFTDTVALHVHEGEPDERPDAQTEVMFQIAGASRPWLSYDAWIVDDPALAKRAPARPRDEAVGDEPPFTVKGNGDGVLQPGERVLLAFVARNDGDGIAPDVRAVLRNLSGAQGLLEEGLVSLGELAPGKERSGAFGLTVNAEADPKLPFELELIVGDATLRTSAQDKLRFAVLPTGPALQPERVELMVRNEAVRLYGGAHPSTVIAAEVDPGGRLAVEGRIGKYFALAPDAHGRRLFVPAELPALVPAEGRRPPDADRFVRARRAVAPPEIELGETPRVTSAASIRIEGVIEHPVRVRDVAVFVRPPGVSQLDEKVHYEATPGATQRLPFAVDVPLRPGGNAIIVLARDGAKVQSRREVWVYREDESGVP